MAWIQADSILKRSIQTLSSVDRREHFQSAEGCSELVWGSNSGHLFMGGRWDSNLLLFSAEKEGFSAYIKIDYIYN
jgi:hypothetical protein